MTDLLQFTKSVRKFPRQHVAHCH